MSDTVFLAEVVPQLFGGPSPRGGALSAKVDLADTSAVAETKRDREVDDLIEDYDDAVVAANELERTVDQAEKSGRIDGKNDLGEAVKKRAALAKRLREALERDRKLERELKGAAEEGDKTAREKRLRILRRIDRIKDALDRGSKSP